MKKQHKQQEIEDIQKNKILTFPFWPFNQVSFQKNQLLEMMSNLFPWGCSQLKVDPEIGKNDDYKCLSLESPANIGLSIKYGIISTNLNYFTDLHEIFHKKQKYQEKLWIFLLFDGSLVGFAQVIGSQPSKNFKYWLHEYDQFNGIIRIKYYCLGNLDKVGERIRNQIKQKQFNFDDILNYLQNSEFRITMLTEADHYEHKIREKFTLIKNPEIQKISQYHQTGMLKLEEMLGQSEKKRAQHYSRK